MTMTNRLAGQGAAGATASGVMGRGRWSMASRVGWLIGVAGGAWASLAAPESSGAGQVPGEGGVQATAAAAPAPYLRVVDDERAGTTTLEIAVRSFRRGDGTGPVVHLAGAVHIADAGFYTAMQEFLDAQGVVLFEGVKPAGVRSLPAGASDEQRRKVTTSRLKVLSAAVERFADRQGRLPASLEELAKLSDRRLSAHLSVILRDAWDRPMTIEPGEAVGEGVGSMVAFTVRSKGADVGDGPASAADDVTVAAGARLGRVPAQGKGEGGGEAAEPGRGGAGAAQPRNVQQKLADALGLDFQLDHMVTTRPNWRSSDLSIDEVQERLEASGGGTAILDLLDPGSFTAKLAGVLIGFVGSSKAMATTTKLMLVETLAQAGPEMGKAGDDGKAEGGKAVEGAPKPKRGLMASMGPTMKVIVEDRNTAVLDDLKAIVRDEPGVTSVAAFYGAGHMHDLETRLVRELGMQPTGDKWYPAITVKWTDNGLNGKSIERMRASIRRTVGGMMR